MMEFTLTALMGKSETGSAQPLLVLEWPDRNIPNSAAMSAAHHVIADVYAIRGDAGAGWLIFAPGRPERTASCTTATIRAQPWPGNAAEANEAMAVFKAVVDTSRRLLAELNEFAAEYSLTA